MTSKENLADSSKRDGVRVLVTGANGFIGSVIVSHCMKAGMSVKPTGRSERNSESLPGFFKADITDAETLTNEMEGIDAVVHAAGLAHQFGNVADGRFESINTAGTENVARSALKTGVKHFVLISSVAVYGAHKSNGVDENSECWPVGGYARSKYEAEIRATEILKGTSTCLTILRLATVYGEGDPGNVARLMKTIARKRFIWIGRGENRKSLIHRDDVGRACAKVLSSECSGVEIYNLTAPAQLMRDVVDVMSQALRTSLPSLYVPRAIALTSAAVLKKISARESSVARRSAVMSKWLADDVYDGQKFERRFNFSTQVTLKEGLQREVNWYKKRV